MRGYSRSILIGVFIPLLVLMLLTLTSQPVHASAGENQNPTSLEDNLQAVSWWQAWSRDNNQNRIDDAIDHVIENVKLAQKKSASYVISGRNQNVRASLLVDFRRAVNENDVNALSKIVGSTNVTRFRYVNAVSLRNVRPALVKKLAKLGDVVMVELQQRVRATLDVSTRAVKARSSGDYSSVWDDFGVDGTGVNIAVLDTGVDDEHESLNGKYVAGVDTTGPTDLEFNPDDLSDHDVFHGTHVAGIAMGDGGAAGSYMGVAPGAGLVDVRVLNEKGEGTSASVIRGIEWCIANKDKYNIKVLNLSLGTDSNSNGSDAQSQAVNEAVEAGLIVVAAVGNDGEDGYISSPSAADGAISAGALFDHNTINRSNDTVASYSNGGPRLDDDDSDPYDELKPDITSPGTFIWSAKGSNGTASNDYHQLSGTSMATPHVAGVIALMLQANSELTPDKVKEILHDTAEARGVPYSPSLSYKYSTNYGWGMIDAYAAVRSVTENVGPPDFSVTSNDISFSDNTPVQDQKILVSATIHNEGEYEGTSDVAFYKSNGTLTSIGRVGGVSIPGGESEVAKIEVKAAIQGDHTIKVVVENSSPSENNTANNQASKDITVSPPPVEPDLTLTEYDIRFPRLLASPGASPISPLRPGRSSSESIIQARRLKQAMRSIRVDIYNVGQTDATCNVMIYYDQKTPAKLIENFTGVSVEGSSDNYVRTSWFLPENIYGDHTIYAVIENVSPSDNDPLNNEATRDVSLPSKMEIGDIAISDDDISFSDNAPTAGSEISVNATVYNTGVINVENVRVVLYVDNIPIGMETIPHIKQGFDNSTSIQWKTEKGEHVIKIRASLEDVEESNNGNNTGTKNLSVGAAPLMLTRIIWIILALIMGVGGGIMLAKIKNR